ncbi:FAD-dependent monooxygenase [Nioella nitratireducens]|uniref:FAD-dependent monooxygenase n=1 Tax=Nioella nitratireducens TaxID=1287720 RepID=UPI0009FC484B|nr:FAD-dependent monooxygenase [Nioella nitratireducens]
MLIGQKITVLGAGIGGLAAATALAQRGAVVRVLEQADAIREVGAGLQISPNGAVVLRALGLGGALAEAAPRAHAVVLRDFRRGAEVFRMPLTRDDRPYHLTHRADLVCMLRKAAQAAGVAIELGRTVEQVTPGNAGTHLRFASGGEETVPLLIGADGLHSPTRASLNPATRPFFTGQVAWRCTIPLDAPDTPPEATVHMGPGRHIVTYPLRGGELMNVIAVEERDGWAAEGWNHKDSPENLRRAFADFPPEIRDLLFRAQEVYLWGLFRHPVAKCWGGDSVALLGDAAHPTLPFLAQGANMALEDAWVLAEALDQEDDTTTALTRYEAQRKGRTARIVEAASQNARNYHLHPGPYRAAAHMALRIGSRVAPQMATRPFEWLYGHDVTHGAGAL